jgi:hypothetical protein
MYTSSPTIKGLSMTRQTLGVVQILWPAFLVAGVLEMVVFSWVDPGAIRMGDWQPDTMTTYSVSFLLFWALVACASGLSRWLMVAPDSTGPWSPRMR